MKRISTGERVGIDLFKQKVDRLRFSYSNPLTLSENQVIINEIVDTTPSSSFENDSCLRDQALVHRASFIFMHEDNSDDEYFAGAVIDETNTKKMENSELFKKVQISDSFDTTISLLHEALSNKRMERKAVSLSPPIPFKIQNGVWQKNAEGSVSDDDDDNEEMDIADSGGCSSQQLISAILKQCQVECVSKVLLEKPAHAFDLRIADDEEPDLDFPELDCGAAIIDVGVKEFVLCEAGTVKPLLVINLNVEGNGTSCGGSSLVFQVSFFEPKNRRNVYKMTLPIELFSEPIWSATNDKPQTRRRGSSSRTTGISMEGSSGDPSALLRIRNIDTGEEINVRDYDTKVPKGISPARVFSKKIINTSFPNIRRFI